MKEAGLANEESSAPNEASSISNEESSAPATQDTTQDTTQETEGGLFDTPAAETEALDDAVARKAISYVLGMEDTFLKKDSSAGRQYSIQQKTREMTTEEVKKLPSVSLKELLRITPISGIPVPTFRKVGELKNYIKKAIPPEKREPINLQTQWNIHISGQSFEETVNYPNRRLHPQARLAAIPVLPELIRIARYVRWEDNRYGETKDPKKAKKKGQYYYFDAPYFFGEINYIAHLVFRQAGPTNYVLQYDHDLSTVEEIAASEKELGGGSSPTGEADAATGTTPTATSSNTNVTPNPENSSPETEKKRKIFLPEEAAAGESDPGAGADPGRVSGPARQQHLHTPE